MPETVSIQKRLIDIRGLSQSLSACLVALFILISLTASVSVSAKTLSSPLITEPTALEPFLLPVMPPADIVRNYSGQPGERWFRLSLAMPVNNYPEWIMVFRRTPHQHLDVFIPATSGYQMISAGTHSESFSSDPRTIKVKLQPGQTHSIYFRVNSPEPNEFNPELWPEPLYTLQEYKTRSLLSGLQTLIILFLLCSAVIAFMSHQQNYLLLTAHLLTTATLLIMWQGDVFRSISWAGDPGFWLLAMTGANLISAIACYGNLGLVSLYSPRSDRILLWSGLLAGGTIIGYPFIGNGQTELLNVAFGLIFLSSIFLAFNLLYIIVSGVRFTRLVLPSLTVVFTALFAFWQQSPWPRAVVTEHELTLLCLQSLLITGLYWVNRQQKHRQAISVNRVVTFKKDRRIFDHALREYLQAPASEALDEKSIRRRILETLDSIVPGMPSMLLTRHNKKWSINSYYPKAAERLKAQMGQLSGELIEIINTAGEDQITLEGSGKLSYWVQLIHSEENHHTLLIVSPGRHTQTSQRCQYILDISSHARTLFHASQQTRYWKLQASLDPLTQALNRRAFMAEAEKQLLVEEKRLAQSCLIFIDLDDFKQINDQYGHQTGDRVLSLFAARLRTILRQKDISGRYGGEEFIVLLPGTESLAGVNIAERIRHMVSALSGLPVQVTASLGIAATGVKTNTLDQLIQEADAALYKAKEQGKNRTVRGPSCQDLRLFEADPAEQ